MDERSRLLESHEDEAHRGPSWLSTWWQTWRVAILCYIVAWLADAGDTMRKTPKTRLLESIICRRYYENQGSDSGELFALDIDESLCKVHEIQAELAMTKAWLKIGENLLALILAIPFGHLANRKGRNFVLTLGMIGQMLSEAWFIVACRLSDRMPFQLVYISVFLKSAGGGAMVLSALVHAILSDVMSRDRQAQAFFYLASTSLLTEVIAPPLGSILMETGSSYTPLLFGFPLELLSLVFISLIPDTSKLTKQLPASPIFTDAANSSEESDAEHNTTSTIPHQNDDNIRTTENGGLVDQLILVWKLITRNGDIARITIAFLVTTLARETLDFVVQYTSERFGWSLSKANYLISLRAIVNLILLIVILPGISRLLTQRGGMFPAQVDLWIARGSAVFGFVGSMMMGLSASPAPFILSLLIFILCAGISAATQSYATSLVPASEVTILFSALAVVSIAGTLVASPLLAATFRFGMSIGGAGLGLPFFVGAGFFVVSGLAVWTAGMPDESLCPP